MDAEPRASERQWSPIGFLLLFWGGAVATGAYGLINRKWGWVILAAGLVLIGWTHVVNIQSVKGSYTRWISVAYDDWGTWSLRINTVGNVLAIVGMLVVWAQ